jgi:hypothetical protein
LLLFEFPAKILSSIFLFFGERFEEILLLLQDASFFKNGFYFSRISGRTRKSILELEKTLFFLGQTQAKKNYPSLEIIRNKNSSSFLDPKIVSLKDIKI